MTEKAKLVVITERGRVIGTQRWQATAPDQPVTAVLRAGPGQKRHVLTEVDVPVPLKGAEAIGSFHKTLERLLRPGQTRRRRKR